MKKIILFLMIFSACSTKSQKLESILDDFKTKNVDSVIQQCSFPFDLSAGSMVDDSEIVDSKVLKEKLQQLFKEKYFDDFFKGKRTKDNAKNKVSYEVQTFNKNGELESESKLSFFFKKGSDGRSKLYKIVLAG
jgi:hypothetical protein